MTQQEKQERFIEKARKVHCDEKLDYSKVQYVNNRTHIIIIDQDLDKDGNEYGEYKIMPCNFLKGQGHPKKRGLKISKGKRSKQEEIIKRFEEVHKGEGLDYSKVNYINMHTKVCIIDPVFGEYWQDPASHLKGCGHPKKPKKPQNLTLEEFIERAKSVHGDRYDYSKTIYKTYRDKVTIICPKHGEFEQTAENHLYGKGCPKCGNHYSKFEDDIVNTLGIKAIKHEHKILKGKEIDVYFHEKKIGIEFNGLKWHTEWFAGKGKHYHQEKTDKCREKGIRLIQIFEDEYKNKDLVITKLKHILGICDNLPKIYGRKCEVKEIGKEECDVFLNNYHIQGKSDASVRFGAFYEGKLIGVMSFKKDGADKWELVRFASDYNYICCGVGGKLFSKFIKDYSPIRVKSFADRRWTINYEDNLYTKLGFHFEYITEPEYRYFKQDVDRLKRFHKFGFRKKALVSKFGKECNLNMSMTETEMAKKLGYDRIWDCGLLKYVWYNSKNNKEIIQ
jgi:hypothetical protein